MATVLEVGQIVRAEVVRAEAFGLFFMHRDAKVFVPIIELEWLPRHSDCRQFAKVGDSFDVKILRILENKTGEGYFEEVGTFYGGSIKDVRPELDPWFRPECFAVGTRWVGLVKRTYPNACLIEIESGVYGLLPASDLPKPLATGDTIEVQIVSVNLGWRELGFAAARSYSVATKSESH